MIYFIESLKYVTSDPYFVLAMSLTSCTGIFIGAVLYGGLMGEARKAIVAVLSYVGLLVASNVSRVLPIIARGGFHETYQPFAGLATILLVTLFYVIGVILGVRVTCRAHNCHKFKK